jgi:hypothetical protein
MLSLARERATAASMVAVAIAAQLIIPARLVVGPVLFLPLVEAALLATLLLGRRRIRDPHHGGLRTVALVLATIMVLATVLATVRLVEMVVTGQAGIAPADLIRAGTGIWITNVIAFAILYWEIDLGGPARRSLSERERGPGAPPTPDFLFPQYDSTRTPPDWQPTVADYLYTSFTNATAFSPTDTMPTGHRAKAMMATQSAVALITMAFLFARAINTMH